MPRFADLVDTERLAQALGTQEDRLEEYAGHAYQTLFYEVIGIPKRGAKRKGEYRTVHAANEAWLAELHKKIAVLINTNVSFPPCVTGFVPGGSIKANARPHCRARMVLHADLKDFFDNITLDQVRIAFRSLGAIDSIASLLARLSTIDGYLRQGTRCSPAIANVVCRDLDAALLALAATTGAVYTRYADNLTFSGERVPAATEVDRIVRNGGFALRGTCTEQHRGRRQFVTGLAVVDALPRLPRKLKQQMRLVLYFVKKHGVDGHLEMVRERHRSPYPATEAGIEGMLRFMHSIEPRLANVLQAKFEKGVAVSEALREDASGDGEGSYEDEE